MRSPPEVIAVFGPTGVGKTAVALGLGERLRREGGDPVAISADALQVYEGLETLTGAPTPSDREGLEHRLVGFVPMTESFSVGAYMPLAHSEIDAALEAGRAPIVVGGTGLYLRAALTRLDLNPPPPPELRERLNEELRRLGPGGLHDRLQELAPELAARVAPSDRSRLVRALELEELGAREARGPSPAQVGADSQLWSTEVRRPTLIVGLAMDREALYRRIDRRVEEIAAGGALDEVRRAAAAGASPTARKALGFEELLRGDIEAMKRRSRNLAKRQLTWMRKLAGVEVVDVTGRAPDDVAAEIADHAISYSARPS